MVAYIQPSSKKQIWLHLILVLRLKDFYVGAIIQYLFPLNS